MHKSAPHPQPSSRRLKLVALPRKPGFSTGEYLIAWLEGRRSLRPSTRVSYEMHLRRYLLPHLGEVPLAELDTARVDAMYERLLTEPVNGRRLNPATVRRIHATLMSALGHAVRCGLLDRNPAEFVDLPRAAASKVQVWSLDELTFFLRGSANDWLHPLFLLLAMTGVRRGEAIGLRWVDVDLERAEIRVVQQIVAVGARTYLGAPKSSNGRRTVAVPDQLARALAGHRSRQRRARLAAVPGWIDSGLVFTTADGEALNPYAVSRRFDHLVAELGLPVIRLHDLRHTSASLGLASGETLLEVSRRLGHSSITITADVYAHVAPVTAHQSAQRLGELILPTQLNRTEAT
ncbi:MAG: Integrase [Jatrophihabitans sp.]|nr:Integrase [Jatrophihabitans sp.]